MKNTPKVIDGKTKIQDFNSELEQITIDLKEFTYTTKTEKINCEFPLC